MRTPDEIVGLEVLDNADGGQAGQFDFLAFHGGRLVDDQDDAGALRRARRHQFRGESAGQSILRCVFVIDINVVFAGDQQSPAPACTKCSRRALSASGTASVLMLLKTTS